MKVAALDLGSNTFLCLICEVKDHQIIKIISDETEIVRLGQGLNHSKVFHPDALVRAKVALERFKKTIEFFKPEKILAMATSAARDAKNGNELFNICNDLDIPLEIISGNQEAHVTYIGSVSGLPLNSVKRLVVDIGGGSTEFIAGYGQTVVNGLSQNIGCVRLTEKYFKESIHTNEEISACRDEIRQILFETRKVLADSIDEIIAVAGTPTALVAAELNGFDSKKIDGFIFTSEKLEQWFDRLKYATLEEKIASGIPAGRADVILVGIIILIETLHFFELKQMIVSTRGVRYGIALQLEKNS